MKTDKLVEVAKNLLRDKTCWNCDMCVHRDWRRVKGNTCGSWTPLRGPDGSSIHLDKL